MLVRRFKDEETCCRKRNGTNVRRSARKKCECTTYLTMRACTRLDHAPLSMYTDTVWPVDQHICTLSPFRNCGLGIFCHLCPLEHIGIMDTSGMAKAIINNPKIVWHHHNLLPNVLENNPLCSAHMHLLVDPSDFLPFFGPTNLEQTYYDWTITPPANFVVFLSTICSLPNSF